MNREHDHPLFAPISGFFSGGQAHPEPLQNIVCDDCVHPMALMEGNKTPLDQGELLRCLYRCGQCKGELAFVAQVFPDGRVSFKEWSAVNGAGKLHHS